jgi:DUF4097 and DUF4098 domain-containing protein YvlB
MKRNECWNRSTGVLAALALVGALALPAAAGETVEREVPIAKNGEVSVENLAGSVTVKTWDRAMVRITGVLGDDVRERSVDADGDGEGVDIEVVLPRSSGRRNREDYGADLELTIPEGASVRIETVSASVDVKGVQGDVEVESVSGGIDLAGIRGGDVESVSGGITVRGFQGDLAASAVSGKVRVEGGDGALELSSVSGSIEVEATKLDGLEMETVSGSLLADFDPVGDGHYGFESVSGSIDLVLSPSLDARIEVEVFSGRIVTEFDGDHDEAEYGPGAWFHGQYGDGSAEILIENHSGSVELRKR